MTQQQKDVVIQLCNQIGRLGVSDIILRFNVSVVGQYTLEIYESLVKRVARQLIEELQNGIGIFLPNQYNYNNEFGRGNLDSDLQNFMSNLSSMQSYLNTEAILNRLIYYQIANGFWDRGQRKIHPTNEVKALDIQNRTTSLARTVAIELEKVKAEKKNLADFVLQKTNELQKIDRNLSNSNINADNIATLLNQSIATNEKVNSILIQQQAKLEESKELLEEHREDISQLLTDFEGAKRQYLENLTEFENKQVDFQGYLSFVESKRQYFEERNNYLDELIGREVGASLFETFKQRKNELNSPVSFWRWSVPLMAVLTVAWIAFLFKDFVTTTDSIQKWQFLALNTLKTIPAIILTYFAINQYRKERNFQEEYAFKSAVALTISEYAKKLSSPENKDKLIMESVNNIFISPIERRLRTAELNKISFNETIKSIKDTVTEIAGKIKS